MEIASHLEHQTWLFIKLSTSAANVIESKHTNNKIGEVDYETTQSATNLIKKVSAPSLQKRTQYLSTIAIVYASSSESISTLNFLPNC